MLSDEEKKAIKELTEIKELFEEDLKENYEVTAILDQIDLESLVIALNLIEKQYKEIEESEQKEKKAYIDGTNIADKLCNKKWKDKIKAKIEEIEKRREKDGECELALHGFQREAKIEVLQSLLEKE